MELVQIVNPVIKIVLLLPSIVSFKDVPFQSKETSRNIHPSSRDWDLGSDWLVAISIQ